MLLARLADGALRDALSLLDQCAARSREITADVVAEATGMVGRDYLHDIAAAVRERRTAAQDFCSSTGCTTPPRIWSGCAPS